MHKKIKKSIAWLLSTALILTSMVTGAVPVKGAQSVEVDDYYETFYSLTDLGTMGGYGVTMEDAASHTLTPIAFSAQYAGEAFNLPSAVDAEHMKGFRCVFGGDCDVSYGARPCQYEIVGEDSSGKESKAVKYGGDTITIDDIPKDDNVPRYDPLVKVNKIVIANNYGGSNLVYIENIEFTLDDDTKYTCKISDLTKTTGGWGTTIKSDITVDTAKALVYNGQYQEAQFDIPSEIEKAGLVGFRCLTSGNITAKFRAANDNNGLASGGKSVNVSAITSGVKPTKIGIMNNVDAAVTVIVDGIVFVTENNIDLPEPSVKKTDTLKNVVRADGDPIDITEYYETTYTPAQLGSYDAADVITVATSGDDITIGFPNAYREMLFYKVPRDVIKRKLIGARFTVGEGCYVKMSIDPNHSVLVSYSLEVGRHKVLAEYYKSQYDVKSYGPEVSATAADLADIAYVGLGSGKENNSVVLKSITFLTEECVIEGDTSTGTTDPGTSDPGTGGGTTDPGTSDPGTGGGTTDPGTSDPGTGGGTTDPGTSDPGTGGGTTDPGTSDPGTGGGTTDPGTSDPGTGGGTTDPGTTDPGTSDPGTSDPGTETAEAVKTTYTLGKLEYVAHPWGSTKVTDVEGSTAKSVSSTTHYQHTMYKIPEEILAAGLLGFSCKIEGGALDPIALQLMDGGDIPDTVAVTYGKWHKDDDGNYYEANEVWTSKSIKDGKDPKSIALIDIMSNQKEDEELTFVIESVTFLTKTKPDIKDDPGTTDPGTTDPGTTDPGTTDPGTSDPGTSTPTQKPENVVLKDAMTKVMGEDFIVGTAICNEDLADEKEMALVTGHFNALTFGNELKPQFILTHVYGDKYPENELQTVTLNGQTVTVPKLDFSIPEKGLDYVYNWNRNHPDQKIKVRGHVLVWHSQTPEWFFHEDYDKAKPYVDAETMSLREEWYIKSVAEHFTGADSKYKDMFYGWDVVNEAVSDWPGGYRKDEGEATANSGWWAVYKSNKFITDAFVFANKYFPASVELYYNDYGDSSPNKSKDIVTLLTDVKNTAGARIDGMGMQAHYPVTGEPSADDFKNAVRAYCKVVDHVQITELDFEASSEYDGTSKTQAAENKRVAARYKEIYDAVLALKKEGCKITGLTVWGVIDKNSWLNGTTGKTQCPLLFDNDYQPKKSFYVLAGFDYDPDEDSGSGSGSGDNSGSGSGSGDNSGSGSGSGDNSGSGSGSGDNSGTGGGSTGGGSTGGGSGSGGSGSSSGGSIGGGGGSSSGGSSSGGGSTGGGSSSGGSSSGGTAAPTTTTETKPDGTKVETTTQTTPDKTTTTVNETRPDGSTAETKTETVTKSDGSKTETKTETEKKADGSTIETKTETEMKPDGTVTETKVETETKPDGTVTETRTETETKSDGSATETKIEKKADGSTTETRIETKSDGSATESVKETAANGSAVENTVVKNASGEVVQTVESTTKEDGKVTEKTVYTATEELPKTTVTIKKDAVGAVTLAKATVEGTASGNKASLDADAVGRIVATAGTENVTVTMIVKDDAGKTQCKVKANTADLKAGNKLYAYKVDAKTGAYTMVESNSCNVDASGSVSVEMGGKGTYNLVDKYTAKQINREIKATIVPKNAAKTVKCGKSAKFALDSGASKGSIKSITYKSGNKSLVTVDKNGKMTAKKSGTTTVKAKVTLKNGATKTIKMKVKVTV